MEINRIAEFRANLLPAEELRAKSQVRRGKASLKLAALPRSFSEAYSAFVLGPLPFAHRRYKKSPGHAVARNPGHVLASPAGSAGHNQN